MPRQITEINFSGQYFFINNRHKSLISSSIKVFTWPVNIRNLYLGTHTM